MTTHDDTTALPHHTDHTVEAALESDDSFFDDGFEVDTLNEPRTAGAGERVTLTHTATDSEVGQRLDKFASSVFSDFSRANVQRFIEAGELTVNGQAVKPKYAIRMGDVLTLDTVLENHSVDLPEDIAIDVVYADDAVLVINKPAGMVVHPGAGNRTGTLVNALLFHYPEQAHLPRAGLVHRIDKDTTGLLVIARTKAAQLNLTEQLKRKSVYRHYQCVALGAPYDILRHATIDAPIGRHSTQRTKMAVRDSGKPAITHITAAKGLHERYSLCDVQLETGRTHQIRVHLAHRGHPLVGDKVYGTSPRSGLTAEQREALLNFPRQALHAYRLGFIHPVTGEQLQFMAPLPEDMQQLIVVLSDQ